MDISLVAIYFPERISFMRKLWWYLSPFLLLGMYCLFTALRHTPPKLNQARLILLELRGGDFTHAGDREAIDMVLNKLQKNFPEALEGNCLDVGCGFGGTAEYLRQKGFKHVWGIDVDQSAIDYAKSKYKAISFLNGDALLLSGQFESNFFSFVYLFNVLYAIEDKVEVLKQLARVSKPGAILMVFDYSVTTVNSEPMLDLAGKPMRPISMKNIENQLQESGWKVLEVQDISSNFIVWYEQLLKKLEEKSQNLKGHFLEEDIAKVSATYVHILHHLHRKSIGGILIYAKRI